MENDFTTLRNCRLLHHRQHFGKTATRVCLAFAAFLYIQPAFAMPRLTPFSSSTTNNTNQNATTSNKPFWSTHHQDYSNGPYLAKAASGEQHTTRSSKTVANTKNVTAHAPLQRQHKHGPIEHGPVAQSQDNNKQEKRKHQIKAVVIPPYYHREGPKRAVDIFFPIFWRWKNKREERTTYIVGPWFSQHDKTGSLATLFPLFWRAADHEHKTSTTALLPLAYRHKREDGSHFNLFFPFYFGRSEQHWNAGIVPLFFSGASRTTRHAVIFPFFWHFKSPTHTTTVFGPAFFTQSHDGWSTGLVPLFFAGRSKKQTHQVLFPIYWHIRDRDAQSNLYIVGPAFHQRRAKTEHRFGLLPIFAAGRVRDTRYLTLPPLLFHGETSKDGWLTWLGPYWGHRRGSVTQHRLWPIAFFRRNRVKDQVAAGIFPLFYYHRDANRKQVLITPLFGFRRLNAGETRQGYAGLYAWHNDAKRRIRALVPLFVDAYDKTTKARTQILLPLAVRHISPKKTAHILFPIFWRITDQTQRSLVLPPFFWQIRRRSGENADVLFPLYWHFSNKRASVSVAGPAYWHKGQTSSGWGIAPLALYHRNKRRSLALALPLFLYHHDFSKHQRTWAFGPLWGRSYRDGYAGALFPLAFFKRTSTSSASVLFPLFWRFSNKKSDHSLTVLGPVFHHRNQNSHRYGLLPLFYGTSDGDGQRTTAIFPLFWTNNGPHRRSLFTALFGFYRSSDYAVWYAGPYVRWRSRTRALDIFGPLGFFNHHRASKTSTMFLLPGYYGSWNAKSSTHVAFPLYWRRKTVDTTSTFLFPVLWDAHSRFHKRTTAVLPFFLRHANYRKGYSWWLTPPGVWIKRHRSGTDAVVFPVFWRFAAKTHSSTVVFPLFWDFNGRHRRTTTLFPLFWRFDRPSHRTYVVLNTYYRKDKSDGTYDLVFFPLFRLRKPRPNNDWQLKVLGGLFGYERFGQHRQLTLFFMPVNLADVPNPGKNEARRQHTTSASAHKRAPSHMTASQQNR